MIYLCTVWFELLSAQLDLNTNQGKFTEDSSRPWILALKESRFSDSVRSLFVLSSWLRLQHVLYCPLQFLLPAHFDAFCTHTLMHMKFCRNVEFTSNSPSSSESLVFASEFGRRGPSLESWLKPEWLELSQWQSHESLLFCMYLGLFFNFSHHLPTLNQIDSMSYCLSHVLWCHMDISVLVCHLSDCCNSRSLEANLIKVRDAAKHPRWGLKIILYRLLATPVTI